MAVQGCTVLAFARRLWLLSSEGTDRDAPAVTRDAPAVTRDAPAVTRGLGVCGLGQKTAPFYCPVRQTRGTQGRL